MRAVLIDNEEHVRQGLQKMLSIYCPQVVVAGEAEGVATGKEAITELKPDIVFLDVEMDDGSGIELMQQVPERNFHLIFVTAHDQYAMDAFRFSAIDYLLKPVDPDELTRSVQKVRDTLELEDLGIKLSALSENLTKANAPKKIVLKDATSLHVVAIDNIVRCDADGSYTTFHFLDGKKITVSRNLKEYERMLTVHNFFRPHHSHLVNLSFASRFDRTDGGFLVMDDNSEIPVSKRKKDLLIEKLRQL